MSITADVARCSGDEDRCECAGCLRRTDRSTFPLQVWIAAPDTSPCPMRIPVSLRGNDAAYPPGRVARGAFLG